MSRASGIDVVFVALGTGPGSATERRTIVFAPGEQIPRIGECVILAFHGDALRWHVQDVAHVFEDDAHGVAIKLTVPHED
ncbi:hypothetical protein [Methylobacterium trifolii]|uniref:hypothetical protein n=1 Tax=Methylobacterium trifolii TaxID=1003092 RepID=UPI001EE0680D|nr:hypothetical protein [Methylobacterium trifolii]